MKKLLQTSIFMAVLTVLVSTAFAAPENFGGEGEAWDNDYGNHYVNQNNPDLRMDWANHRFAVPGQGGAHADDDAAVMEWGSGTLVDPHDTMP